MGLESGRALDICRRGLSWARDRDYTGWEKHDALNSPVLAGLSLGLKWPRIVAIQSVMRFPVNLRPVLGVRKHKNPKGAALFARAWLNLYAVTGNEEYLEEACTLLDWLLANPSAGDWPGLSWGYPYPWQDPGFYAPSGSPNRIVTYFAGRALIHGFEVTGDPRYLDGVKQAAQFILKAPKVLFEDKDSLCLSYIPDDDITMAVMDVPSLCGALCSMVGFHAEDQNMLSQARRLVNWVADKQTGYGAWYYTHPAGDSHITHDNYHTGEILDSLLEYERYSGDTSFRTAYSQGLTYYRENLFTDDARPKWMNDRRFPHDAHGYAQGIISFTLAGDIKFAANVAGASVADLWDEKSGRFYYQKTKRKTKNITFMRWCQGWLLFAMTSFLAARNDGPLSNTDIPTQEKNDE